MNHPLHPLGGRKVTTGVAIVAGLLLLIGGTWRGVAAELGSSTPHSAASVTRAFAHRIFGARDSYADVVKVVAPAVVTIRTEGKTNASPTQFQVPNDDPFRRSSAIRVTEAIRTTDRRVDHALSSSTPWVPA
jgi:S1-C subfamily serine protease